jgi:hypothetical protein
LTVSIATPTTISSDVPPKKKLTFSRPAASAGNIVDKIAHQRQALQFDAGDHDLRNQRQNRQIQAAHHRDLGQNLVHVVGGVLAGTNAGNESAVLAHVVRRFIGIENDGHVEEAEENDQTRTAGSTAAGAADGFQHAAQPPGCSSRTGPVGERLREGQQRRGEDHRESRRPRSL